jgi:hypothetical protein
MWKGKLGLRALNSQGSASLGPRQSLENNKIEFFIIKSSTNKMLEYIFKIAIITWNKSKQISISNSNQYNIKRCFFFK